MRKHWVPPGLFAFRFGSVVLAGTALALTLPCLTAGTAQAYRFALEHEALRSDIRPGREPYSPIPALRWSFARWRPGAELSIRLYESPDWTNVFENIEDVKRTLEDAMAEWSSIESADIFWSVRVMPEGPRGPYPAWVRVEESGRPFRTEGAIGIGDDGTFSLHDCHVVVSREFLRDASKAEVRFGFRQELGHCFGLRHPGSFTPFSWRPLVYRSPSGWNHEPLMGDGTGPLTADDIVGASLMRPAVGWHSRIGSILGYVLTDSEEPAKFVHVLATRVRPDGTLAESVGRLVDGEGVFVIGGLAPGDYVLSVRPFAGHAGLLAQYGVYPAEIRRKSAVLDFGESFLTTPVSVTAGQQTGPVGLTIRPTGNRQASSRR